MVLVIVMMVMVVISCDGCCGGHGQMVVISCDGCCVVVMDRWWLSAVMVVVLWSWTDGGYQL